MSSPPKNPEDAIAPREFPRSLMSDLENSEVEFCPSGSMSDLGNLETALVLLSHLRHNTYAFFDDIKPYCAGVLVLEKHLRGLGKC